MRVRVVVLFLLSCLLAPALRAQTSSETVLYTFGESPDAQLPDGSAIQASDGNFYGGTLYGGANNGGAIYRITPGGSEYLLYSFCALSGCPDGYSPTALIQGTDGNLYGVASSVIFKLSLGGAFTVMHTFTTDAPYYGAAVSIVEGSDGNFYGGLAGGNSTGGVFKMTPSGTYSVLYGDDTGDFEAYSYLVEASDGYLYGFSVAGGTNASGNLFRVSLADGSYSDVYDFCTLTNCADGTPSSYAYNMVEGSDGALYGTTFEGGVPKDSSSFGEGVFFRFDPATLKETVEHTFCTADAICSDGARPSGTIFLSGNGLIYGFDTGSPYGGTNANRGLIYGMSQTGSETVVYDYNSSTEASNNGILQGADGNLYDPIDRGGPDDNGEFSRFAATGAPVQVGISPASITAGQTVTLTWSVKNAFSKTMQRCFASGGWSGLKATSGSVTVKPAASTTYSLTCGGIETGMAAITVGTPKTNTTTTVTGSPNPVAPGASATLTAQVTSAGGTPGGNVVFSVAGMTIATVALKNGTAAVTASTAGLPSGQYDVTAAYQGNGAYSASHGNVVETISQFPTSTIISTPSPIVVGQGIVMTATVSRTSGSVTPTGTISFYFAESFLASVKVNSAGTAMFTEATLGAGVYPVYAIYNGDTDDQVSTSNTVNVTINWPANVALTASPNPATRPAVVTLTATVTSSPNCSCDTTPTGSVTFKSAGMTLGKVALNKNGIAQLKAATGGLPAGSYPVTAAYSGDSMNGAATSSTVTEVLH